MKNFQIKTELQLNDQQRSLQFLQVMGLPIELENMPHTGASVHLLGKLPLPSSDTMRFLFKNFEKSIWKNHLIFLALILAATNRSPRSVYAYVMNVQKFLTQNEKSLIIFDEDKKPTTNLTSETVASAFEKMLGSSMMIETTLTERLAKYHSSAKAVADWFRRHKDSLGFSKHFYENLLLPPLVDEGLLNRTRRIRKNVESVQKANRKLETDVLFPHFKILYAEANLRLYLFERFYEAALQAENYAIKNELLIYSYSYMEGDFEVCCEVVHINFVLEELAKSSNRFFTRRGIKVPFSNFIEPSVFQSSDYFVNICNAHELDLEKFWFIELAAAHVFYQPITTTRAKVEKFCASYDYSDNFFFTHYTTRASRSEVPRSLPAIASEYLNSIYISHHELRLIFNMAAFALEFFLTSGARINEVLQIAVHPDVLKKVKIPKINNPSEYIERYVALLIPKGQDEATPFFLTDSTFSALNALSKVVAHNNTIFDKNETIYTVVPDKQNAKYHLLAKRPFIFQVDGKHLSASSLTTMVRFLLHDIVTYIADDGTFRPIKLKAHLLRHIFATNAVQVEKTPLDILAKILNQKHLATTAYYSEPTMSVIAHHHTNIAENMLFHLNLDDEAKRLPDDMITLYETSRQTSGTLTEVIGGTCTSHGHCPAKTACVGCGSKVPDPSKRDVIERKLKWAIQEKEHYHQQGLGAEERKMDVLIRDCRTELWEMDQIKLYLDGRDAKVQVFDSQSVPLKWVDAPEVHYVP